MLLKLEMQQLHTKQPCKRCLIHSNLCVLSSCHRFQKTYGARSSCCWSKTRQNCVRLQGPVRNGESRERVGECCQSCSKEASGLCFYRNWCMVVTTPRIQVAFISIPSGMQLKSVRWMLRSNQSAKSWNLPVSRRIVSVVKWILPDIFTIQTSVFEDVFTIFYNLLRIFIIPLQSFTIYFLIYVFFKIPIVHGMCQAKGLQEDLGRARAATAELEVQTARCHAE